MAEILVFGDSIVYGERDKEGGWVQRLRKFFDEKMLLDKNLYYLVYNLGISGDTTEDLLRRFEFEMKQRLEEDEEKIIIFAVGINDSSFVTIENNFNIPIENFKENIQRLVKLARKFSSKVIFIGLTPVEESKVTPYPWSTTGKHYKNEYIQKYNEVVKSACKQNQTYFIDAWEIFTKLDFKKLLEDGLHPNSEGHRVIFEEVRGFLIKNKILD